MSSVDIIYNTTSCEAETACRYKDFCMIRNPSGLRMEVSNKALRDVSRSHHVATGETTAKCQVGFAFMDPREPGKMRERLKPGDRFGTCRACEKTEEGRSRMGL